MKNKELEKILKDFVDEIKNNEPNDKNLSVFTTEGKSYESDNSPVLTFTVYGKNCYQRTCRPLHPNEKDNNHNLLDGALYLAENLESLTKDITINNRSLEEAQKELEFY